MKTTFYGVYFVDAQTGDKTLCEVDGGVCYMAYRDLSKAEAIAASCNESAEAHGWDSRYTVSPIPAGVLVWDDFTASKVVTEDDGVINISDLPSMDHERAEWLKNRWTMFWGAYDDATRASMTDAAHNEALYLEAERIARAEEAIAPARAQAVLMNSHMDLLPVDQVVAIFAQNPTLQAHIKCRQIAALIQGALESTHLQCTGQSIPARAALYRAEGLEMGFSYNFLLEHARKASFAFATATRQLRAIRSDAAILNAHIESFLPNAPERKVLTAYATNAKD